MSDPQGDGPNPPSEQPEQLSEIQSPAGAGGAAPKRAPAPIADDEGGIDGPNPPSEQP